MVRGKGNEAQDNDVTSCAGNRTHMLEHTTQMMVDQAEEWLNEPKGKNGISPTTHLPEDRGNPLPETWVPNGLLSKLRRVLAIPSYIHIRALSK